MSKARKTIPVSVRFAILNRDNFTCQYCGKSAPDVILEIDHKVPYSQTQDNSIENLITSCKDCNRGKSDSSLESHVSDSKKDKQQKPYADIVKIIKSKFKHIEVMHISEIVEFLEECESGGITEQGLEFFAIIHTDWDLFVEDMDKIIDYIKDTGCCYDLFFSSEEDMFLNQVFETKRNCSKYFRNYKWGSCLYLGLSDVPMREWYRYFKMLDPL